MTQTKIRSKFFVIRKKPHMCCNGKYLIRSFIQSIVSYSMPLKSQVLSRRILPPTPPPPPPPFFPPEIWQGTKFYIPHVFLFPCRSGGKKIFVSLERPISPFSSPHLACSLSRHLAWDLQEEGVFLVDREL